MLFSIPPEKEKTIYILKSLLLLFLQRKDVPKIFLALLSLSAPLPHAASYKNLLFCTLVEVSTLLVARWHAT